MNTTLALFLAAAPITAFLAAPAVASNYWRPTTSTEASYSVPLHAYGSVSPSQFDTNRGLPPVQDCARVAFPQCSGGN